MTNQNFPCTNIGKDLKKFKSSLRFYIKGRSSFQNAWAALMNSDLLEESGVKIQTLGVECKRSVNKTHISSNFNLSSIKISDSGTNLVRDILHAASNITNSEKEKSDDEFSIVSTNSEE